MTKTFDADLDHPWVERYRIPRVTTSYPGWRYEVALVVPTPGDTFKLDGELLEPTEAEAEIIAAVIEERCARAYGPAWRKKMRERAFDVDSGSNTLILAKTPAGWRYRRATFRDGLCPPYDEPDKQAQFPPSAAGLVTLLVDVCGASWQTWMADHPRIMQLAAATDTTPTEKS